MDKIDIIKINSRKRRLIMQIFYAKGEQSTDFYSEKAVFVNNCGFYRDIDRDMTVNRPMGRDDYHLLMTSSGAIDVDGKELGVGKVYIFYPSSPQRYRYVKGEESEYYWLHFSGQQLPELLERFGLHEGMYDIGSARGEIERLIKMMLRALSEKYAYADDFCDGLLRSLLAIVGSPPVISSPFNKAIKILSDPSDNTGIEALAATYNMSANHFIRSFKQYVGCSPNAFRITKRMEIASEILLSTDLNVESVAETAGYSDPLYFSRAFKKHTGYSPSEYRAKNR